MKKLLIVSILVLLTIVINARPNLHVHQSRPNLPRLQHYQSHNPKHHHNLCIGSTIIGSVIFGSTIINNIVLPKTIVVKLTPVIETLPVVIQRPVVTTVILQPVQVWIEGRYIDLIQTNGTIIRVWQPGHYEWH